MPEGPEGAVRTWIETFQGQVRLDLRPQWRLASPGGAGDLALHDPWGAVHRPDWHARGLADLASRGAVVAAPARTGCARWPGSSVSRGIAWRDWCCGGGLMRWSCG